MFDWSDHRQLWYCLDFTQQFYLDFRLDLKFFVTTESVQEVQPLIFLEILLCKPPEKSTAFVSIDCLVVEALILFLTAKRRRYWSWWQRNSVYTVAERSGCPAAKCTIRLVAEIRRPASARWQHQGVILYVVNWWRALKLNIAEHRPFLSPSLQVFPTDRPLCGVFQPIYLAGRRASEGCGLRMMD